MTKASAQLDYPAFHFHSASASKTHARPRGDKSNGRETSAGDRRLRGIFRNRDVRARRARRGTSKVKIQWQLLGRRHGLDQLKAEREDMRRPVKSNAIGPQRVLSPSLALLSFWASCSRSRSSAGRGTRVRVRCVRVRLRNKKIDDIATAPTTRRLPADQ